MNSLSLAQLKPYILPISSVVVLVVLIPLVIMPWIADIQTSWAEMSTKQDTLDAMKHKGDQLDKMDGAANKQQLQSQVIPAIPNEPDPAGLLGTIDQLANASGTVAKGISYGASTTSTTSTPTAATQAGSTDTVVVKSISVNLSIEGNFANIVNFINRAQTIARVVSIDTLHIVPAGDEDGGGVIATIAVTAPYEPLPQDLGPAESPLPERTAAKTHTLDVISKLQQATYAPTPPTAIEGRSNPF